MRKGKAMPSHALQKLNYVKMSTSKFMRILFDAQEGEGGIQEKEKLHNFDKCDSAVEILPEMGQSREKKTILGLVEPTVS